MNREKILLKACRDLLEKQQESSYVLDILAQTVIYDDTECDGSCLLDDINAYLSEVE